MATFDDYAPQHRPAASGYSGQQSDQLRIWCPTSEHRQLERPGAGESDAGALVQYNSVQRAGSVYGRFGATMVPEPAFRLGAYFRLCADETVPLQRAPLGAVSRGGFQSVQHTAVRASGYESRQRQFWLGQQHHQSPQEPPARAKVGIVKWNGTLC